MTEKGWKRAFDDPIPLPCGRQLVTLEDAGTYITELPKGEHTAPEWQDAMEALMLVARGGPTVLARIGVIRRYIGRRNGCSIPSGRKRIGGSRSSGETNNNERLGNPVGVICVSA
jgi:hypothetical protein